MWGSEKKKTNMRCPQVIWKVLKEKEEEGEKRRRRRITCVHSVFQKKTKKKKKLWKWWKRKKKKKKEKKKKKKLKIVCVLAAVISIDGMCDCSLQTGGARPLGIMFREQVRRAKAASCVRERARTVRVRGCAEFIERVPLSLLLLLLLPPSLLLLLPSPPAQAAAAWVVPLSLHFGELLLSS